MESTFNSYFFFLLLVCRFVYRMNEKKINCHQICIAWNVCFVCNRFIGCSLCFGHWSHHRLIYLCLFASIECHNKFFISFIFISVSFAVLLCTTHVALSYESKWKWSANINIQSFDCLIVMLVATCDRNERKTNLNLYNRFRLFKYLLLVSVKSKNDQIK